MTSSLLNHGLVCAGAIYHGQNCRHRNRRKCTTLMTTLTTNHPEKSRVTYHTNAPSERHRAFWTGLKRRLSTAIAGNLPHSPRNSQERISCILMPMPVVFPVRRVFTLGPMVRLGWGAFSAHSLVTAAVRLCRSAADPVWTAGNPCRIPPPDVFFAPFLRPSWPLASPNPAPDNNPCLPRPTPRQRCPVEQDAEGQESGGDGVASGGGV